MAIHDAVLILAVVLGSLAAIRFITTGNAFTFAGILVFVLLQVVYDLVLFAIGPYSRASALVYDITEPLQWLISILVLVRLYRLAFRDYPGVASLARWMAYVAALLAIVLCVVLISFTPLRDWSPKFFSGYIVFWDRSFSLAISAFILLMLVLLSRYPIRLDSNVAANIFIFSAFYFGAFVALEITAGLIHPGRFLLTFRDDAFLAIQSICFVAWVISLKKRSEITVVQVRSKLSQEDEHRLLGQLSAINDLLLRAVRQ